MPGKPSLGALLHIYSPRYVKSGPGDLLERPEKSPTLWGPLTRNQEKTYSGLENRQRY